VDYFSPGLREIRRFGQRTNDRVRLRLAQRNLVKAETHLGLLGWQAADFDGETQRQVEALQNVEREQADLTNRAAELSRKLETIAAQRAKVRLDYDQRRTALEADTAKVREPLADIERKMRVVRENLPDVDRRVAQLDKEEREADALYKKLLSVQPQTQEVSDEILRHRDRLLAIPNEREDLKRRHARGTGELQTHERTIATITASVGELDGQLREAKSAFDSADGALAKEQREAEREKARVTHETDRLERAKHHPYLEIGRVLADSGVAPVNQPEALTHVQEFRYEISFRETAIADSLRTSAAEDREAQRISLGIWAVVAVLAFLLLAALF
jgi:chromosome segregation ATPase